MADLSRVTVISNNEAEAGVELNMGPQLLPNKVLGGSLREVISEPLGQNNVFTDSPTSRETTFEPSRPIRISGLDPYAKVSTLNPSSLINGEQNLQREGRMNGRKLGTKISNPFGTATRRAFLYGSLNINPYDNENLYGYANPQAYKYANPQAHKTGEKQVTRQPYRNPLVPAKNRSRRGARNKSLFMRYRLWSVEYARPALPV